jgi:hypothetical protein
MTYPSKRIFAAAGTFEAFTDAEVAFFGIEGWEPILPCTLGTTGAPATPTLAEIEPTIQRYADVGLPVWLEIETNMNGGTVKATPYSYYDFMLAGMATADADDRISGFVWEYGYDNGIEWLRDHTDKILSMQYIKIAWENTPYFINDDHTIDYRLGLIDELVWETFAMDELGTAIIAFNYVIDNFPNIKLGINQQTDDNTYVSYWGDAWNPLVGPFYSYEERKKRAQTFIYNLKAATQPFNVLHQSYGGAPSVTTQCDFSDSLGMFGAGTKGVVNMRETGLSPLYSRVSECVMHSGSYNTPLTPPIDAFVNTGNELILLKSYGVDCAAHVITVTSTDTLTHEDYKLALSPNRGTVIGPFPAALFGSLPTITYDNTNLHISILKAALYSEVC